MFYNFIIFRSISDVGSKHSIGVDPNAASKRSKQCALTRLGSMNESFGALSNLRSVTRRDEEVEKL